MAYPKIVMKDGAIQEGEIKMDYFSKPLEFRSLKELSDHLEHEPFSYYEPPTNEENWNCLSVYSYKTMDEIRCILRTHIDTGSFKLMEVPKIFQTDGVVCAQINGKNSSQTDENKKILQATVFFFKMYGDMDVLFAIRKAKKNANNMILISMDDRDKLKYYKYIFIIAHIFGIRF